MPNLVSLVQVANIILTLRSEVAPIKKFVLWRMDGENQNSTNSTEILENLLIKDVNVEDSKKMFEHPIETGATITDHCIIEPEKVSITVYIPIDDSNTLKELEFLYVNSIPLKLRAENTLMENMIVASKPRSISAEHFDKTPYTVTFQKAQVVIPKYVGMPKAKNKANRSRVNSGVKQAKPVKKSSWLFSAIRGGRT